MNQPVLVVLCRTKNQFLQHLCRIERLYPEYRVIYGRDAALIEYLHEPLMVFLPGWDRNPQLRRNFKLMRRLWETFKIAREHSGKVATFGRVSTK